MPGLWDVEYQEIGPGAFGDSAAIRPPQRIGIPRSDATKRLGRRWDVPPAGAHRLASLGRLNHGPGDARHGDIRPGADIRAKRKTHVMRSRRVQIEQPRVEEEIRRRTVNDNGLSFRDEFPFFANKVNTVGQERAKVQQARPVIHGCVMRVVGKERSNQLAFRNGFSQMCLRPEVWAVFNRPAALGEQFV